MTNDEADTVVAWLEVYHVTMDALTASLRNWMKGGLRAPDDAILRVAQNRVRLIEAAAHLRAMVTAS